MKKIIIDDVAQITSDVIKLMDDFENVLIVGYYETIVEAFNLLMKLTDNEFVSGELYPVDYDNYEDAYYLECNGGQLYFGKARWNGHDKYIMFDFDKAFVEEDFLDDFLTNNDIDDVVVFGFEDVRETENVEKSDGKEDGDYTICMDDDEKGFCFCINNDFEHTKFKYRGDKKLNRDEVMKMVHEYI